MDLQRPCYCHTSRCLLMPPTRWLWPIYSRRHTKSPYIVPLLGLSQFKAIITPSPYPALDARALTPQALGFWQRRKPRGSGAVLHNSGGTRWGAPGVEKGWRFGEWASVCIFPPSLAGERGGRYQRKTFCWALLGALAQLRYTAPSGNIAGLRPTSLYT